MLEQVGAVSGRGDRAEGHSWPGPSRSRSACSPRPKRPGRSRGAAGGASRPCEARRRRSPSLSRRSRSPGPSGRAARHAASPPARRTGAGASSRPAVVRRHRWLRQQPHRRLGAPAAERRPLVPQRAAVRRVAPSCRRGHALPGRAVRWGGASPSGFDCSGFTMYVYARWASSLPHSSRVQYGVRHARVSRGALQPGDLVFFGSPIHHVGIYVGGGSMIDAPYTGHQRADQQHRPQRLRRRHPARLAGGGAACLPPPSTTTRCFLEHDTGEHPETADRLCGHPCRPASTAASTWSGWNPRGRRRSRRSPASTSRLRADLHELAAREGGGLDLDTVVSPASYDAALLAAGAGVVAVDRALETGQSAFLLVRPPGHHACRSRDGLLPVQQHRGRGGPRPRGAGAGAGAHRRLGRAPRQRHPGCLLRRSAGALLQHARGRALSRHRGTRGGGRAARRPATRSTCRCGRERRRGGPQRFPTTLLAPLARAFRPQLVLVSAGYDAQAGDPLGDLRFSQTAFQWMAARLVALSPRSSARPVRCASSRVATCPR